METIYNNDWHTIDFSQLQNQINNINTTNTTQNDEISIIKSEQITQNNKQISAKEFLLILVDYIKKTYINAADYHTIL